MNPRHGIEISFVLLLRNNERELANLLRTAQEAVRSHLDDSLPIEGRYEILACDLKSHDNTLSVLSVLHNQYRELRTVANLPAKAAIARGAQLARGRYWLFGDARMTAATASWALSTLRNGTQLASIPDELLAIEVELGRVCLRTCHGDLEDAQIAALSHARRHDARILLGRSTQPSALHSLLQRIREKVEPVPLKFRKLF